MSDLKHHTTQLKTIRDVMILDFVSKNPKCRTHAIQNYLFDKGVNITSQYLGNKLKDLAKHGYVSMYKVPAKIKGKASYHFPEVNVYVFEPESLDLAEFIPYLFNAPKIKQ